MDKENYYVYGCWYDNVLDVINYPDVWYVETGKLYYGSVVNTTFLIE